MSKPHKPADPLAHPPTPNEAGETPKDAARPQRPAQAPGHAFKFHQQKANARRNLPYGPLGGSGRKTNASRSS